MPTEAYAQSCLIFLRKAIKLLKKFETATHFELICCSSNQKWGNEERRI